MKLKLLVSALLSLRNIAILMITAAGAFLFNNAMPGMELYTYLASLLLYIVFTIQSLASKEFHENFNYKQKVRLIQDLNYSCMRLASEAKKHTNSAYLQKLRKVMDDKNEIVNSFFRGKHNFLKEKIVEQTLNLVVGYIKLLTNFCIRSKELGNVDIGEVTNRINANLRKLNFTKDPIAVDDIKRVMEMDEKIITRLKDEKRDLERINTKLDYMESTVSLFKHQILSNIESEDMLEKLETAVNEASALDTVLEERRRNRISL